VFEDVEAYVLRGDALGTILFDIESVDAFTLYREYAGEMQGVYAKTGGHAPWAQSESSAGGFPFMRIPPIVISPSTPS
jgi:hypothetical protein